MEVITIESGAFREIMRKLEEIGKKVRDLQLEKLKDQWLTGEQVIELLKISKRTLQSYRDTGKLGFSQIGAKIYYKVEEVHRFLDAHFNRPF